MATLQIQQQNSLGLNLMNQFSSKLRATVGLSSETFRCFCAASSSPSLTATEEVKGKLSNRRSASKSNGRVSSKVSDAQLKENWLDSLSCPFPEKLLRSDAEGIDVSPSNSSSSWVIGVDPDVSGALALLKPEDDDSGSSAQVFDSPIVKLLVGGRARRRLDANSIVRLLMSFDCPVGTTAYLEQSVPFPGDGKQGWWSGGFAYGLWIGVLVASGFNVIPVPSVVWKNEFKLSGNGSSKDSSRELASTLFPSMSSSLRRKKDHGRAEALLIAAYGKGLQTSNIPRISEDLTS